MGKEKYTNNIEPTRNRFASLRLDEDEDEDEFIETKILSLNDDALKLIFNMCSLRELMIMSQVCRRFRYVIYDMLRYRKSMQELPDLLSIVNIKKDEEFMKNTDIPNIFKVRKSGENLSSLNVAKTNERLQAAVNKEPDPSLYNRPNDLTNKLSNTSKSTLNSFLQKMTGFRVRKSDENTDKRIFPNKENILETFKYFDLNENV